MKDKDRRRRLSDLMILTGVFLLLWVALIQIRTALAAQALEDNSYLISTVGLNLPLPTLTATPTPIPTAMPSMTQVTPPAIAPPPAPTRVPSTGSVIRLIIPRIKVDRTVVSVKLKKNSVGQPQWNTDALFSTANRRDLVGQLSVSTNPGDGGNIILVGHNYNQGWDAWGGVFLNIDKLRPGDQIILHTEKGGKFEYVVRLVKKVPWQQKNNNELEKHQKFLWPTDKEQVTLVTCGGVSLLSWSARVYVVALPIK